MCGRVPTGRRRAVGVSLSCESASARTVRSRDVAEGHPDPSHTRPATSRPRHPIPIGRAPLITVQLSRELALRLDAAADSAGLTRSDVVRLALEAWLVRRAATLRSFSELRG